MLTLLRLLKLQEPRVQFLTSLENGPMLHNPRQNLPNDVIIVDYDSKNELAVAVVAIELWILQQ